METKDVKLMSDDELIAFYKKCEAIEAAQNSMQLGLKLL